MEVCAAFGAGEHFVGVAALRGVEDFAEFLHRGEVGRGKLFGHEIDFFDADAVFAGDAAAEFDAFFKDVIAGLDSFGDLFRIAFIVEDERMDVAVASVKDVRNAQIVFGAGGANEAHDFGKF